MRVAGVIQESLQDGVGCNLVVFFQGCNIGCPGCHNKELWDMSGGKDCTVSEIMSYVTKVTTGITVSGGEPTLQWKYALALLKAAKKAGLKTTLYTGLTKEQFESFEHSAELLVYCDYIKIGPYIESRRITDNTLYGSSNQAMYKVVLGRLYPMNERKS